MRLRNLGLLDFLEYVKNKNLICLGAGRVFERLCRYAKVETLVRVVLDNNADGIGERIIISGQEFRVDAVSNIKNYLDADTVLFITASAAGSGMELYESLKNSESLSNVECFFANFVLNERETIKRFCDKFSKKIEFKISEDPLIPKYIHYCWFGDEKIPEKYQKFIHGWHEMCPDFQIICWNESNYDYKKNEYMKKAYESGKWGFVSDYARKDIIYEYGGIYLDIDVQIIKPLNELLYQKGFAGTEPDSRVAFGLGFGAEPHLEIIKEMRDAYEQVNFSFSEGFEMKVGPDYETGVLEKNGYKKNNKIQYIADLTIYPMDVLSGTLQISGEPFVTPNTFSVHHYARTWASGKRRDGYEKMKKIYREIIRTESNNSQD